VHLAVALARHHFGRPAGSLADLGMIECRRDMLAVEIARFLHRQFPQLQAAIHARRSARKEDFTGELLIVFRLDRCTGRILGCRGAVVVKAAGQSFNLVGRVEVQRVLVIIDTGEPPAALAKASLVELLEEESYTRRNNGVENHFDVIGHDIVDGSAVFHLVEWIILLKNYLAAILFDELAGILIEDMWPDVICGRESKALAAVLYQPGDDLVALLRRGRSGAKEEGRAFLPFILLWINVERLPARDDGVFDGVAHRTGDAAQHDVDFVALDESADIGDGDRFVGGRVYNEEFDGATQNAAGIVDVLHHHLGDVGAGVAYVGDGASKVGGDSDLDRCRRRIRPIGLDGPGADAGCYRSAHPDGAM